MFFNNIGYTQAALRIAKRNGHHIAITNVANKMLTLSHKNMLVNKKLHILI